MVSSEIRAEARKSLTGKWGKAALLALAYSVISYILSLVLNKIPVIGPIANDGVAYLLGRYEEGTLTIDELSKELDYKKLNNQYFFGTEKAIKYLKRI